MLRGGHLLMKNLDPEQPRVAEQKEVGGALLNREKLGVKDFRYWEIYGKFPKQIPNLVRHE